MKLKFKPAFKPDYTDTEHWYLHTETGVRVPSVTTIESLVAKPWLTKWKIKEGLKHIIKSHGQVMRASEIDVVLEEAYTASEVKSEQSRIIGDKVHTIIEKYLDMWLISGKKPKVSLVNLYEPNFVIDTQTHLKYDLTQTQIIAALRSAEQYIDSYKAKPVLIECVVGDVTHKYAGKLDAVMQVDGKYEIWDWKTSNYIPLDDSTYPMQINAYRKALEKQTNITIHKQRIIQLSKDENRFTMFEVELSEQLLEAFYGLCKLYDTLKVNKVGYYTKVSKHS